MRLYLTDLETIAAALSELKHAHYRDAEEMPHMKAFCARRAREAEALRQTISEEVARRRKALPPSPPPAPRSARSASHD